MPYGGEKTTVARKDFAFRMPAKDMAWHPYPAAYKVTNDDLQEQFLEESQGQDIATLMTNANSAWKWLGDYILTVDATVATNGTWTQAVNDFFAAQGAFATAGQPAQWEKKWWDATFPAQPDKGFNMPNVKRKGWMLENWRYGNHIGYYYFIENSIVKNNQYDDAHEDSVHIWARWIEKCLYEDYMPYLQSEDTSAIDLKQYNISANEDLLILAQGKTMDIAINRIMSKTAYNVVRLPFEISKEVLKQVTDHEGKFLFDPLKGGKTPKVYAYDNSNLVLVGETRELHCNFHELESDEVIQPGVPFLIRPAEDVVDKLYFKSVYINSGEVATTEEEQVELLGTWSPENMDINDNYQIYICSSQTNPENPYLEKVTGTIKVPALSGYLKVPVSLACDYAIIKLDSEINWHPYPAGYKVTNDDLWEQFVEDTVGQNLATMLTAEQSTWKWLGDYIQTIDTTVAEQATWEQTISDFFNAENEFATAGLPANWESLWWNATFPDTLAQGAVMPKVKRHGWVLENWRYGNDIGYYYFSEPSIVVNNQYDKVYQDSSHIWARWLEVCMYEDYMTYIQSDDTSAIDFKHLAINANMDLMTLIEGQTREIAFLRTLQADVYNTVCLPFDLTQETLLRIKDANGVCVFDPQNGGAEAQLYVYDDNTVVTEDNNIVMRMNFHPLKEEEVIKAGVPFLIKPQVTIQEKLYIDNVYLSLGEPAATLEDDIAFVGILEPTNVQGTEDYQVLVVNGNEPLQSLSEKTKLLALNGYFIVPTTTPAYDYATIYISTSATTPATWVEQAAMQYRKIMMNQRIYILKHNAIYTVEGQKQ